MIEKETSSTKQSRKTNQIKILILAEISDVYRDRGNPSLKWIYSDSPYELWMAEFRDKPVDGISKENFPPIGLIWNGKEVVSYEHLYQGIREYLSLMKERRIKSTWNFVTSPLTIGAIIGVLLVFLVAGIMFYQNKTVPDQLWSLITAVIAFYFGKGSVVPRTSDSVDE